MLENATERRWVGKGGPACPPNRTNDVEIVVCDVCDGRTSTGMRMAAQAQLPWNVRLDLETVKQPSEALVLGVAPDRR